EQQRRAPVEAMRRPVLDGPQANGHAPARGEVDAHRRAVLVLGVHRAGVFGIDLALKAIAAVDALPVVEGDALRARRAAQPAPGAVVLEPAVDAIRLARVHGDAVELADRQIAHVRPLRPAVAGVVDAAVGA